MARKQSTIEGATGPDQSVAPPSSAPLTGKIRVRVKGPGTITVGPVGTGSDRFKRPGDWLEIEAKELPELAHAVETEEQAAASDLAIEMESLPPEEGKVDQEFMARREMFRKQADAKREAAEIFARMQAGLPTGQGDSIVTAGQRKSF